MDTTSKICLYTYCLTYLLLSVISWKVTQLIQLNSDLATSLRVCDCVFKFALNALNLSELNQGCGWWTLSLWKRHDLFLPSAIWCVFSGLIRGNQRGISVLQMTVMETQRQRQQMEEAMICWWRLALSPPGTHHLRSTESPPVWCSERLWSGKLHPQMKWEYNVTKNNNWCWISVSRAVKLHIQIKVPNSVTEVEFMSLSASPASIWLNLHVNFIKLGYFHFFLQ